FFFFQAEDGIRDRNVTGVQTCALPIWKSSDTPPNSTVPTAASTVSGTKSLARGKASRWCASRSAAERKRRSAPPTRRVRISKKEIGRASCRERVEIAVEEVS